MPPPGAEGLGAEGTNITTGGALRHMPAGGFALIE